MNRTTILTLPEIKSFRRLLGITQEQMGNVIGISRNAYQQLENRGDMKLSQAIKCSEFLQAEAQKAGIGFQFAEPQTA